MIAMGAAAAGMGVLGALGSRGEAESENAARAAQYSHQIARETWQHGQVVWATAQKNANRWIQNQYNMEVAAKYYGRNQIALAKSAQERRKQISRAQKNSTARATSQLSGKIGLNSGTAERILKQMEIQGSENWSREFNTKINAERQLEQQFENNLRQGTDLSYNLSPAYMPGLPPQMANVGMATMMGGLQGAAQGVQMVGGIMGAVNSYQQWAAGSSGSGGWTPIEVSQ